MHPVQEFQWNLDRAQILTQFDLKICNLHIPVQEKNEPKLTYYIWTWGDSEQQNTLLTKY